MNITEDYVSFETAKLLKENGFDEQCFSFYEGNSKLQYGANKNSWANSLLSAPTLQMAMKWMREVHKLHITVYSCSQESWAYRITKPHQELEDGAYEEDFAFYEETCDAAIKYCLEKLI